MYHDNTMAIASDHVLEARELEPACPDSGFRV